MVRFPTGAAGEQAAFDADLVEGISSGALTLGKFPGTWINADDQSVGLAKVQCRVENDALEFRVFGAGPEGEVDWGPAENATIHGTSPVASEGTGISARYTFPELETRVQANLKGGVMVIVAYNRFTDGSGRQPYFMREFLTLEDDE